MKMINFSIILATDIDNLENNPKYDIDEALYKHDFKKAVICHFAVPDSSYYADWSIRFGLLADFGKPQLENLKILYQLCLTKLSNRLAHVSYRNLRNMTI